MMYFTVSFQYSESVYCTNIAIAENEQAINDHYSQYEWFSVSPATDAEVEAARRKGMPIVEIESKEEETMTYTEMITKAIEVLKDNDEIFVDMVNELDSWNGYADGFRGYPMWEIDDIFCDTKVSDFLDKLAPGFCHTDEYFVDTIYGIDSCDDLAAYYRDNVDEGDLLDHILDNSNHLYFSDSDFEQLINDILRAKEEKQAA